MCPCPSFASGVRNLVGETKRLPSKSVGCHVIESPAQCRVLCTSPVFCQTLVATKLEPFHNVEIEACACIQNQMLLPIDDSFLYVLLEEALHAVSQACSNCELFECLTWKTPSDATGHSQERC